MNAISANPSHVDIIVEDLIMYFSQFNSNVGFKKYITDRDIIHKHVSKRIEESSPEFKYLILTDDSNTFHGFLNYRLAKGKGEVLILNISEDTDFATGANILLEAAMSEFRDHGIKVIETEVAQQDEPMRNLFLSIGAKPTILSLAITEI